jgi:hypothetical protein
MSISLVGKVRRVPISLALVVFLIGAASILSAGCSGNKAPADNVAATDVMPLAARVDRLDGEVGIDRQNDAQANSQDLAATDWGKATVNTPVSVGSRVYVKDKSHAAIAFSGRNYARFNPNTSLDVLSLSQRRTQLALREGSGIFDVGALAPGELFEVATPNGAVDFQEPGLYQVGIDDRGSTLVSVLSGIAQVIGLAGSGRVSRGQLLTFGGGQDAYASQLDSRVCGNITNDYYSYRYPKTYDGRYADYQRYQDDPYYYDPYRRSASYQYIHDDAEVAGLDDLDDYGDWEDVPSHGHCWHPRVSSDWAPYRDGSWYDDQPLGLTWVSNERWGWAPYHYGRWTNVNQRWYWVPGEIVSRPVYAPALVAFVPFPQDGRVGWVPLGVGDPYVPRYYDRNYQPQYIGSTTYITKNVNVTNIVNYNVPGAVTVVRTTEITRVITPASAMVAESAFLARTRPVTDPYAVPGLRELAPNYRAHGRVQVPDRAHQALNRDVVTSQDPTGPPVAANTVKALKVKSVPEAEGNRKLQINSSGKTVTAIQPNGLPASVGAQSGQNQTMTAQERQARIAALTAQTAQGDKSGKRELRQLRDQQRVQEKADRRAAAQAAAAGQQQQQEQLKTERKQAKQQTQQQAATQQQQQQQQKKAERKQAKQQTQQPPVTQQQQQQQQKQQQRAERKAAQQQTQQPPVTQQQQKQKQQQKAERKAAQQQTQQPPVTQQQQQQKRQQRAERKAAQQQTQQPPVNQQQQQQQKAERKAAQQQTQQPPVNQQQQQQQKAERKAAQQQTQQPPPEKQQQKQPKKAERKAAQQQQPPAQTTPSKAERKAEKAKNKNGNNNPNQ